MKVRFASVVPFCLLFASFNFTAGPAASAQEQSGQPQGPTKYLFLSNVDVKPGQGDAYQKLESDEAQALRTANAPSHHIAMWAITGGLHVVYMHSFDSFADLQKNHDATMAMSRLMDTMKTDNTAEASLIADRHTSIYSYEPDLSLNAHADLSKMRFMRIIIFHVRRGHDQDFKDVAKQFIKAYQTALPEAHWAMFEKRYGVGSDNTYILATALNSLSDVDVMRDNGKKFDAAVGADQLKTLHTGMDAAVESSESDLFAFSPQMSYVPSDWDQSFWGKK
jgi:hypothetical protein